MGIKGGWTYWDDLPEKYGKHKRRQHLLKNRRKKTKRRNYRKQLPFPKDVYREEFSPEINDKNVIFEEKSTYSVGKAFENDDEHRGTWRRQRAGWRFPDKQSPDDDSRIGQRRKRRKRPYLMENIVHLHSRS